ncbi:MAG TPA: DMT family transporter [Planctomycetota bacterium]|nr:DMT family transporter [Planctomycetota bacterium]
MPRRVLITTLVMIVLWGSHFPVATLTMKARDIDRLSPHALLFHKLLLAGTCLFLIMLFTGRLRELRKYSWSYIGKLVFAGVFGYFLYYFFLFGAAFRAEPADAVAEAAIINYLFPMCTLLASAAIIGEKLTVRAVVSGVICLGGAYIVVCRGDFTQVTFSHPRIDLLALLAAVSWGIFSALGRRWKHEPLSGMFIFIMTGLVVSGGVLLFTGGRRYPVGWEFYGAFHVGFICNTVGVILWFQALKHGGASLVGNLALLTAFVNLLFIRLLLPGQTIHWTAVVGLVIIILGVLLSRTGKGVPAAAEVTGPPE